MKLVFGGHLSFKERLDKMSFENTAEKLTSDGVREGMSLGALEGTFSRAKIVREEALIVSLSELDSNSKH